MHKKAETWLHFVGIGGIGMSGIAEVFLNQGYRVTGSDLIESETTQRLENLGAKIHLEHRSENVAHAHVVIISSAIRPTNPEVLEAKRLRIPVIPRAEMLGELMRGKVGIAVAGTHGKTTTTSMLATVLTVAGLDPTLVIGGKVDSFGGNAKLGQGNYVVAEADESDGSFLHLPATYGIVTNIDADHLDHFGNLEAIESVFIDFISKLPFYGVAAVCGEDEGVKRCLQRWTKPFVTYGFSDEWDVYAQEIQYHRIGSEFTVYLKEDKTKTPLGIVRLAVPGKHNVLNALAAVSIALHLEIPFETIARGLLEFRGVKRRFDIRWQNPDGMGALPTTGVAAASLGNATPGVLPGTVPGAIIDDYAHHPTEILATLAAVRNFWPGRIVSVFQPHRYTRTQNCKDLFSTAFALSDVVAITDIYAGGEEPIPGIDSHFLVTEMKLRARPDQEIFEVGNLVSARKKINEFFQPGDLILCLGAGNITRLADQLTEDFTERFSQPLLEISSGVNGSSGSRNSANSTAHPSVKADPAFNNLGSGAILNPSREHSNGAGK